MSFEERLLLCLRKIFVGVVCDVVAVIVAASDDVEIVGVDAVAVGAASVASDACIDAVVFARQYFVTFHAGWELVFEVCSWKLQLLAHALLLLLLLLIGRCTNLHHNPQYLRHCYFDYSYCCFDCSDSSYSPQ